MEKVLLDTKISDLEILEFKLGENVFGMNVLKVREIIVPVSVTKIPHSHDYVEGIVELRGEVLPVINLRSALGMIKEDNLKENKFIVSEFNNMKIILRVDHVTKIHRLSWEVMEKPQSMKDGLDEYITGVLKLEDKMILTLDVEKVLYEIYPNLGKSSIVPIAERADKRIAIAEDSPMLRQLIQETLVEAAFEHLMLFENGLEAWEYLQSEIKTGNEQLDLLITDIEMPHLDGLTLTKRIKDDTQLCKIPVIVFSSLITDQLRHKGDAVGVDGQISKPELSKLVEMIDKLLHIKK